MDSSSIIERGETLCSELESSNNSDYLTEKIVNEVRSALDTIKGLDQSINNVNSEIETKRQQILWSLKKKKNVPDKPKEIFFDNYI